MQKEVKKSRVLSVGSEGWFQCKINVWLIIASFRRRQIWQIGGEYGRKVIYSGKWQLLMYRVGRVYTFKLTNLSKMLLPDSSLILAGTVSAWIMDSIRVGKKEEGNEDKMMPESNKLNSRRYARMDRHIRRVREGMKFDTCSIWCSCAVIGYFVD